MSPSFFPLFPPTPRTLASPPSALPISRPSYEFVRLLQHRIDGVVGPLVESKVEERPLEGDGHAVVAQITDEVFSSTE